MYWLSTTLCSRQMTSFPCKILRPLFPFSSSLRFGQFALMFLLGLVGGHAPSWGQWNVVQNAFQQSPDCIQLTNAGLDQRGAAWHDCPINLDAPFDLTFSINVGGGNGGGDGMCFVLQQTGNTANNLVGGTGGSMGYETAPFINPSVMVEIDTWQNTDVGDISQDHIGISSNGNINHNLSGPVQAHPTLTNIETGNDYEFRVTWNPAIAQMQVFFEGSLRKTMNVNIVDVVFGGDPLVFWGLTASTGGAVNVHSFCAEELLFASYLGGLEVMPQGPWSICQNETLDLQVSSEDDALNAYWQASGTSSLVVGEPGEYVVLAQDDNGCAVVDAIEVVAAPGPELALLVEEELVVCGADEVVLSATVVEEAQIQWQGSDFVGEFLATSSGVYEVVGQLGTCQEMAQVDVLFQPIPQLSFSVEGELVTGEVDVCFGEFIELEVSATEGAYASWVQNGLPQIVTANSGDFEATAVINGCQAEPEVLHVNLLPWPTATISSSPVTLCWGTTGVVSAELAEDVSSTAWTLPSNTPSLDQAGPGIYELSLVGNNGCSHELSYTLGMLPPIETGLVDPAPLCSDAIAQLQITESVDGLIWNVGGDSPNLQVVSSMGGGPFVATVTQGYCTENDTAWVTWWPEPSAQSLPDTVSKCALNLPHVFQWPNQSQPALGSWQWTVDGQEANSSGFPAYEQGTFIMEIQDNSTGCHDVKSVFLDVLPNVFLTGYVADELICIGDSTEVLLELEAVDGLNPFELPYSFFWHDPETQGWEPQLAGGEHSVTVSNACGSSTLELLVEEEYCGCDVFIPNAFTPDRDGLNEGFHVETSCEFDEFEFEVFNRWGTTVWRSNDPNQPWDGGDYSSGSGQHFLPDGVYPYVVNWKHTDDGQQFVESRVGRILIIR